jgi:hypothetical protein
MDATDRINAQPRFRSGPAALNGGAVYTTDATRDVREAADFYAPVSAGSEFSEDFFGKEGQTLRTPFVATTTETGGTPDAGYESSTAGGAVVLGGDGTSEAQTARVDFADSLCFDSTKNVCIEARIQIQYADDTAFTADERFVFGLASAYNATLDNIAKLAWFRVEGADTALLLETDDGTTDNDDQDVGQDMVNDTWAVLRIDMSDLSAVKFYKDGALIGDLDASAMTGNLQPIVAYQRDAGNDQQIILVDYVKVWAER